MALRYIILAGIFWLGLPTAPLWSWSVEVHRVVNGYAVDLTPGPLGDFLRVHRDTVVALSIDADQRCERDPTEKPNHYIDLEYYGGPSSFTIPYGRGEAEARYGAENMAKWGYYPGAYWM